MASSSREELVPTAELPSKCGELLLLGDLQLGRQVDRMLSADQTQMQHIWGDLSASLLRPHGSTCRLVCANLECAVTASTDPDQALEKRDVHFRLDPNNLGVLLAGHIDYVTLANDHARDFRTTGLRDTMTHLDSLGIVHTGAGRRPKAARGVVIDREDLKYGFMSYSDHPREWAALDKVYGINYINSKTCDHEEVCDPIRAFKAESGVDIMVVSVHWGSMWASGNPAVNIQALFRAMADAGVNVVHGHGSHNLRGVELYKQSVIIYGAGTCVDDYFPDEEKRNDLSAGFLVHIEDGAIKHMDVHPLKINQRITSSSTALFPQVTMAQGTDRDKVLSRLTSYSKALNTTMHTRKRILQLYVKADPEQLKGQVSLAKLSRRVSSNAAASAIGQSASRITASLRSLTASPGHRRSHSTPSAWQNSQNGSQKSCDGSLPESRASTPTKAAQTTKWGLSSLPLASSARKMFKNSSTPPLDQ